jgi:hypothetical protein
MQVGVDHDVDRRRIDDTAQRPQEIGAQMIQHRHPRTGLVIACAGVDQHGQPVHLDDPGLQGDAPAVAVPERRREFACLGPCVGGRLREHRDRQVVDLPLNDAGDKRVAEPKLVHWVRLDDCERVDLDQVLGLRQRLHSDQGVGGLVFPEDPDACFLDHR